MLTELEKRELRNLRDWAFECLSDELFIEVEEEFYSSPMYARLEELEEKERKNNDIIEND